ncbi:hypothetical protein [Variovorax rhizosphaerae]|uniref:Lipoprotein n=1 Tax=Variovorax rhizosphaerae TaxID=1836200 RepID=A0ABU8WED6_9BURK
MKKILLAAISAAVLCLVAGCGTAPSSPANGSQGAGTSTGGSGVEVFGTIDAGVSHYRTR